MILVAAARRAAYAVAYVVMLLGCVFLLPLALAADYFRKDEY